MKADLSKIQLCFVGCGVMAEAIIAGLLRKNLVAAQQIVASHPKENRRVELQEKYAIRTFAKNLDAVKFFEKPTVFLCVKPQRIKLIFEDLKTAIAPDGLVVSIIAGVKIATISEALGSRKVIRAMPNTPAQIGAGITAWTCSPDVDEEEKLQVRSLLTALGKELYVETENMIDMATSLSATGPTYIFLVMEALTDAGVHLGFSREIAKELVQEMMLGSVLFAMESHKHPAELRNMVTSPGGTSAEAIYQMEKGGLRTVLSKAVYAAYKRAVELGEKNDHLNTDKTNYRSTI